MLFKKGPTLLWGIQFSMPPALDSKTMKRLQDVFDAMDTDGSDDLDYDELKAALRHSGIKCSLA